MSASKLKVVRVITDLPPACYRLSSDGRKWNSLCEARQKLANWLALKGNPDGTQIYPGIKKMVAATGWQRTKVFDVLGDLKTIGCVISEHTRVKHGHIAEQGTALRRFDPAPLLTAHAAIKRNGIFVHLDTRKAKAEVQDSYDQESKIGEPTVRDSGQQSVIRATNSPALEDQTSVIQTNSPRLEHQQSAPRADTTVLSDRPNIPSPPTEENLVGWISDFIGQRSGLEEIPEAAVQKAVKGLAKRFGLEFVRPIVERFAERSKGVAGFETARGLFTMLAREAEDFYKEVKERVENEKFAAAYFAQQMARASIKTNNLEHQKDPEHDLDCAGFFGGSCSCGIETPTPVGDLGSVGESKSVHFVNELV